MPALYSQYIARRMQCAHSAPYSVSCTPYTVSILLALCSVLKAPLIKFHARLIVSILHAVCNALIARLIQFHARLKQLVY